MAGGRNYDSHRLTQLILFVAEQCEGDRTFGSVKLNKILWNADFAAYRELGQSITGARYQHQPEGPLLLPMLPIVRELATQGHAREIQGSEGPRHRRLIALVSPDLAGFGPEEIALVTRYITRFWNLPAGEVSDDSHDSMAWRLTSNGQEIPYGTAFLSADPLPEEAELWREELGRDRVASTTG